MVTGVLPVAAEHFGTVIHTLFDQIKCVLACFCIVIKNFTSIIDIPLSGLVQCSIKTSMSIVVYTVMPKILIFCVYAESIGRQAQLTYSR